MTRRIETLVPAFGGNRTGSEFVADTLKGCRWVGIPFAGGMAELFHLKAQSIIVSDLHLHIINLARCVQRESVKQWLVTELENVLVHPLELEAAQLAAQETLEPVSLRDIVKASGGWSPQSARDYFISQWMGRSGNSLTDKEFESKISCRWNANGGGSGKRFRSAVEMLDDFHQVAKRCEFRCMDAFDFLDQCNDSPEIGLYLDPPWPEAGVVYVHKVDDATFHQRLRNELLRFTQSRVLVRYGDHPLIRSIYSEDEWQIHELAGRKVSGDQAEIYIERRAAAGE